MLDVLIRTHIAAPFGPLSLFITRAGALRAVRLEGEATPPHGAAAIDGPAPAISRAFARYFAGHLTALQDLALAIPATPFQRAVWEALRHVPPGATISYGALVARAGHPRAARAVGAAMGANPVPLVIPCHRVIAAGNALGGFGHTLSLKRWLLTHEGATWREQTDTP